MPTPTAKARSPWRVRSARSARETWTCSGSSILRCPGFLPTGRRCTLATAGLLSTQPRVYHGAEDRHFNFNGIRGNLFLYPPCSLGKRMLVIVSRPSSWSRPPVREQWDAGVATPHGGAEH